MPLTFTPDAEHLVERPARVIGPEIVIVTGSLAFGTYATGGVDVNIPGMPKGRILGAMIAPVSGYSFEYVNGKVKVYTAANTEVADATDLSALTDVKVLAWGY